MAPPPPELVDELIEEIVLRLPPDNPASLIRAALVCKSWCRLISSPRFRRRFREFHRSAPMLGFLLDLWDNADQSFIARFVHTAFSSSSSTSFPPRADRRGFALDARHGRVLLYTTHPSPQQHAPFLLDYCFVVWNPITDEQKELPVLTWYPHSPAWMAAVLCAGATCDHLACRNDEPFLVILVSVVIDNVFVFVYSSETGTWTGSTAHIHLGPTLIYIYYAAVPMGPSLLARGQLHFAIEDGRRILIYDIAECFLSVITTPQSHCVGNMGLVTAEGGGLGVVGVEGYKLYHWSQVLGPDGDGWDWKLEMVIELDMMLSIDIGVPTTSFHVVGFAEGWDLVFVCGSDGVYAAALESGQVKKVHGKTHFYTIVPYMSFYTPDKYVHSNVSGRIKLEHHASLIHQPRTYGPDGSKFADRASVAQHVRAARVRTQTRIHQRTLAATVRQRMARRRPALLDELVEEVSS
ncbi:hypothetical protein QOZ80_7BG0584690 [Eleusine coracana subsp. coracana]|nr:hypothetical protein QOZ80_7BG0584690 [Eleusine coracana subsp. coracana]